MSDFDQLIHRTAKRERKRRLVATALSDPILVAFDDTAGGGESWVQDLDIGSNRVVRNVVVKSIDGGRHYARAGQTVELKLNAFGRYQVIGPADRVAGTAVVNTFDYNANTTTPGTNFGFSTVVQPFEFYAGAQAMKGNPNVTFAASTITRATGSFLADNFPQSGTLRVGNSATNDGTSTLTSATALVLTVSGTPFTAGGPEANVAVGMNGTSLWNDAATFFPFFQILDGAGNPV